MRLGSMAICWSVRFRNLRSAALSEVEINEDERRVRGPEVQLEDIRWD
jgi:hypothetical protein